MPDNAQRIGYHYYPNDLHYSRQELNAWLPVLTSLSARWLTLRGSASRAIPEDFLCGLMQAGITPIIHVPLKPETFSATDMAPILSSYARWGLRHVVLFDRPNQRRVWRAPAWGRGSLIERFADMLIPALRTVQQAGLQPLLPPLEPGGDYWDTAFLKGLLTCLARRAEDRLLAELGITLYAWTFNRPLDWGMGGPERWPAALPYSTPADSQDQRGIRIVDWYASIAQQTLGRVPDMYVLAGGSGTPQASAAPDQQATVGILHAILQGDLPDALQCFSFFPLVADRQDSSFAAAWFESPDQPRPIAHTVRKHIAVHQKRPSAKGRTILWPIQHYLLLPKSPQALPTEVWPRIQSLALAAQAVLGFSPEQARIARQVTLLGDEQLIPMEVEQELRSAGCQVRRLREGFTFAHLEHSPSCAPSPDTTQGVTHG